MKYYVYDHLNGPENVRLNQVQSTIMLHALAVKYVDTIMTFDRQVGVTYGICFAAIRYALTNPDSTVNILGHMPSDCQGIISPRIQLILKHNGVSMDKSYKMNFNFDNGSQIRIYPSHKQQLLWGHADLTFCDNFYSYPEVFQIDITQRIHGRKVCATSCDRYGTTFKYVKNHSLLTDSR